MGKRSAVCLKGPSLIEIENSPTPSVRRKMPTPFDNAALTLLSLKQEQTIPGSSDSSVAELGSKSSSHVMSPDSRRRSLSICSSVTDDERSVAAKEEELLDMSSFVTPQSGHSLIRMALVRPKLHPDPKTKVSTTEGSFPLWKVPPQGRPLPAPPKLPRGIVLVSESRKKARLM